MPQQDEHLPDQIETYVHQAGLEVERRLFQVLIDNNHSALRERTHRVKHWRSGTMALRWAVASLNAAAKNFNRILGYQHLWMLKGNLDEQQLAQEIKAGYFQRYASPPATLSATAGTSSLLKLGAP
jgi:hypothetical protein